MKSTREVHSFDCSFDMTGFKPSVPTKKQKLDMFKNSKWLVQIFDNAPDLTRFP